MLVHSNVILCTHDAVFGPDNATGCRRDPDLPSSCGYTQGAIAIRKLFGLSQSIKDCILK